MMETIERRGEVIAFDNGAASVRLAPDTGCGGCGSRNTCTSEQAAGQVLSVQLPADIRLGDQVTVSMPASSIVLSAFLGYLLPPTGLMIGAVMAEILVGGNVAAVVGGAAGLLSGLLLASLISFLTGGHTVQPSICHQNTFSGEGT